MASRAGSKKTAVTASSRGRYFNTGNGPTFQPIEIGHKEYIGLFDPDTAFWSLIKREKLSDTFSDEVFFNTYRKKSEEFSREMEMLRFGLKPSAVYFNPTERCNLNCTYCYIPEPIRHNGMHMSKTELFEALQRLKEYFHAVVPENRLPQVIFHGSEPLMNKNAVLAGIEQFGDYFQFGIQTNATLLDEDTIDFLVSRGVGIGISLDGHTAQIADRTRYDWSGDGTFKSVISAMERLRGYEGYNVICTVTEKNMHYLSNIVDFFHTYEVPVCMLNMVRCTLPPARGVKPHDHEVADYFITALDRTHEIFLETGRKLVIANFANILISIIAPAARRLMCDISPCGGGRCFFAVAANGDVFPCSEFIGLPAFRGGNIFKDKIQDVMERKPFTLVTGRKVEDIAPCNRCAIRHFCGSPCPAEAYEMNGGMDRTGAFCEFYEEQVRYALRLIADGKENDFLWEKWDRDTEKTFDINAL